MYKQTRVLNSTRSHSGHQKRQLLQRTCGHAEIAYRCSSVFSDCGCVTDVRCAYAWMQAHPCFTWHARNNDPVPRSRHTPQAHSHVGTNRTCALTRTRKRNRTRTPKFHNTSDATTPCRVKPAKETKLWFAAGSSVGKTHPTHQNRCLLRPRYDSDSS